MGVPKRKTSKANKRMNRAQRCVVEGATVVLCPQCKSYKQPHAVCGTCGYYKGRPVINMDAAVAKEAK